MPEASTSTGLALWRGLPRELAYLLAKFPVAVTGFAVTVSLFSTGIGTLPVFLIGLVVLVGALYVARGFSTIELQFVGWARRRAIAPPNWRDAQAASGFTGWLRAVIGNGRYWLALLHTMVVDFVVTTATWTLTVTWLATALAGLTSWFWGAVAPGIEFHFSPTGWLLGLLGLGTDDRWVEHLVNLGVGIVFALTLPLLTRGLTTVHWLIARGMLGAFRSDALEREVATLAESRGAAHSAEGHSLRRLERDIHDGPQQRLVRLQMDLAAAERQLATDPDAARGLISEALDQSREALEELRALSRGFAPPILLDRGLVAALESQAARNPVPTTVRSELPDGIALPQELERNAYFIATEALANATKHARATAITILVGRSEAEGAGSGWLELAVHDDGVGGAHPVHGHGLAGLADRARGLGGTLEVSSPKGGPTDIVARLPLPGDAD